ncbi:hypothetical protein SUGI_0102050 [Cryptomeria japonica]|uniref:F-box/kelch-repeat protein At5g60570 n=1 Tax=Cryptomeria japonica TaxID=3369 RepID=UPI00240895BC|nr:F-box/kelch-repeat protein At5g60570 [Cryptomeria japonica]GLJ09113.1 hypothetical protein SUGI_0102050 [Cryptomeria japonica]
MAEDQEPEYCDLIPNMVEETALLCLAKLPPPIAAVGRCVCRSWRKALANPISLRRSLNIPPDHRLFLALFQTECDPGYLQATHHNTEWLLLRQSSSSSSSFPTFSLCNPLSQISSRINLRSAAANGSVLLPELPALVDNKIVGFQSYSVEDGRWRVVPSFPPGYKDIRLYACAALGDFVYFSGGRNELNGQATASGVRYDTVNQRWESLPDMIMPRIDCTGIVLDDKFVVIGGSYKDGWCTRVHTSGEAYDPETGRWTLLPDLWANGLNYVEESNAAQPAVAVIGGRTLYAMQSHSNDLMRFDPSTNRWVGIGNVGRVCESRYRLRYKLVAMGEEVWVITHAMGTDIRIYCCSPSRNCADIKFTELKVAGVEDFDHVLTCAVLSL